MNAGYQDQSLLCDLHHSQVLQGMRCSSMLACWHLSMHVWVGDCLPLPAAIVPSAEQRWAVWQNQQRNFILHPGVQRVLPLTRRRVCSKFNPSGVHAVVVVMQVMCFCQDCACFCMLSRMCC